jgi:release factor glutamine methyltransferase
VGSAPSDRRVLASQLGAAGCVAPFEEAGELIEAAHGNDRLLERLVARRVAGQPLAWVTGSVIFAGNRIHIDPGVYVPRHQTELLVRRAIELLPDGGLAVDLCTGSGAVAVGLARARPTARIVATDIDPAACRCATENGVEAFLGSLADPVPGEMRGRVDVVTGVVPYVPTGEIAYLPRDVREHEPLLALDGGPFGTRVLEQAVWAGSTLLRLGGTLLLELGGDQDLAIAGALEAAGFKTPRRYEDEDGDLRAIEARRG